MKKILIFILSLACTKIFAQTDSGSVTVTKDPRIDLLIKKQIQINDETTKDSRRTAPGFRIQVISSDDRNQVFAAKAKIYKEYPELKPYIVYLPPNYRLRVGNFKTQEEAQVYFDKLSKLYPTGIYIVHDVIEVKPE
ncbi:MAG: SPOR domain-containing protein [Bacteroidetes bacterium]|nr:SPOR domain-containing protein [Bacteroidota bacterium]